jgi:hypothetical protein
MPCMRKSVAPLNDILHEGSAANDAVETMIKIPNSPKEETQAKSAAPGGREGAMPGGS